MNSNLAEVLTAAASSNPQVMQPASLQLQQFAEQDESKAEPMPMFITALSTCVFEGTLPSDAYLLGLIHLKNIVANHRLWQKIAEQEKFFLLNTVLQHLSTGATDSHENTVEQCPRSGRFIAEIVSALFRYEWETRGVWPDAIWTRLPVMSAWLSLRCCLKRASALRLPARRRMLASQVATLLPQLVSLWASFAPSASNPLLRHAIYTCFTAAMDERTAAEVVRSSVDMSETLIRQVFNRLDGPGGGKRTAKLLHCTFTLLPVEVRSNYALAALQTIVRSFSTTDGSSAQWLLAIIYNLLAASFNLPLTNSLSKPPLVTDEAQKQIHKWLFQPSPGGNGSSNALSLILSLMQNFMSLSPDEIVTIFEKSEATYSSGGVSLDGGRTCFAPVLWDADGHLSNTYVLLNNRSDCSPRQLSETTLLLLTRFFTDQLSTPLLDILQKVYSMSSVAPLSRELVLRATQISMFTISASVSLSEQQKMSWCAHIDSLITNELFVFTESPSSLESLCVLCRTFALLVRRAVITSQKSIDARKEQLRNQCQAAIDRLLPFLLVPSSLAGLNRAHSIGVRLAAAHSLQWLLEHPEFEPDSLSTSIPEVLNALLCLTQDADECETRLLILSCIRSTLEVLDVERNTNMYLHFLHALDTLWKIGAGAVTLRASILDLIALLMYALNASPATGTANGGLAASLQEKVIEVVAKDLTSAQEMGGGNDEDDQEVLFEPSLRLWHSLVSGRGAIWSQELDRLMPVLTTATSFDRTLYARLESSEHAKLYFEIARGCLRLAVPTIGEDTYSFLSRWTEPFWALALTEAFTCHQARGGDGINSKFSQATDNGDTDQESVLIVEQLHLLSVWMCRLMTPPPVKEFSLTEMISGATPSVGGPLTPSLSGLLVLHTNACLHKSPIEAHNDICFKATQTLILILAMLACSPLHWSYLIKLVTHAHTMPDEQSFGAQCCDLAETPLAATLTFPVGAHPQHSHPLLLEGLLARLLARADSMANHLHRRCFAVAALICLLLHMASSVPVGHTLDQESVYARWLEPVISLCIQVLFEGDIEFSSCESLWTPPPLVSTLERTRGTIQDVLQLWRQHLGSDELASAVVTTHVDSALLGQFNECLEAIPQQPVTT